MSLEDWGWEPHWRALWEDAERAEGEFPARVVGEHRDRWDLVAERGPCAGTIRPGGERPAVGDWVVAREGGAGGTFLISGILPRRTKFSRAAPGKGSGEQVVGANVDVVWVLHGLDAPFNPRLVERYLTLGWESGARPVLVLTKADLADDPVPGEASELGVPVRVVSILRPATLEALRPDLEPGRTVALLGPSGVGKSSLANALLGSEELEVGEVREGDRKGRHTTTRRRLVRLPGGALLLDTPGMRALRLWEVEEGLERAFEDVAELAERCRFGDCSHDTEPGCAVKEAVRTGRLEADRLESYRKLRAEAGRKGR